MPKTTYTETRLYPVIIHRDADVWGYFSPQFGGGGAASHEDALSSAQQLLESAVADFVEREEDAPLPPTPENVDADGGQVAWLPRGHFKCSGSGSRLRFQRHLSRALMLSPIIVQPFLPNLLGTVWHNKRPL